MSRKKELTWRWVAKQCVTGPFDKDLYAEIWTQGVETARLVFVLIARVVLLILSPVMIPFFVGLFRFMDPINERRKEARSIRRRRAMDDEV